MKRVTAHEARERWFELLDEAVGGEVVIIDKDGTPLTLQRQEVSLVENVPGVGSAVVPDDPREVIRRIKELRKRNRLDGLSIQEMKEEGRG